MQNWMELARVFLKGILKLLFKCDAALLNYSHLWLIGPVVREFFTWIVAVSIIVLLATFYSFNALMWEIQ